jgi:uncharacterized protein
VADTLRQQQFALSRHLRDPAANPPPPGIEERRLAIYRDLFFNNIAGLLAGNFPVIHTTLGETAWLQLVRAFYAQHRSQTPLFPEVPREFIRFLEARAEHGSDDPPWLMELAHYEWVELALQLADEQAPAHNADGDLLTGIPLISPTAWALAYRWPVPRIGPDYQPTVPPESPTLLLVRRDARQEVRFAELSPLVYRLLVLLGEDSTCTGLQVLQRLSGEAGLAADADFIAQGAAMLERMRQEGTLLGTSSP